MSISNTLRFIAYHPLGEAGPIRRVLKFANWQIASRLLGGKILFNWIDDAKLLTGRGEAGVTGNYYVGLMELKDMGFLLHYMRESDSFVDVGANAGVYTVLAAKVVGAKAFCFEPISETFTRLKRQLAINELSDSVEAHNKGVGSKAGQLFFTTDADCMNHVVDGPGENTENVPVVALDDVLPQQSTSYVMKIDVEGFEPQVLNGASRLFAASKVDAVVVETTGNGSVEGSTDQRIDQILRGHGFTAVYYDPLQRSLEKAPPYTTSRGNSIYVRDLDAAAKRVQKARRFKIKTAFDALI